MMESTDNNLRLKPLDTAEMPQEWNDIFNRLPGTGLKGRYSPLNVLGILMYEPHFMGEFLDYWVTSKLKMSFSVREQELIILRMGYHYNCNYIWKHHVPVAREFGVNEQELQAVKMDELPDLFSAREQTLLEMTDEVVTRRDISDEKWKIMKTYLSDQEILDFIHIISQYVLFGLTNNILRVEIEAGLKDIPSL